MQMMEVIMNAFCIESWEVFPGYPHIGCPPQQSSVLPSISGILIMVVIMEGASAGYSPQSTFHLKIIRKSIYPNSSTMKPS